MKLGRFWTLMAAGLVGASLLLAPLAYSAEEGTTGSSMEGQKTPTKTHKAKKHKSGAKKKPTTSTSTSEKPE